MKKSFGKIKKIFMILLKILNKLINFNYSFSTYVIHTTTRGS
jgi:hypothetical protein